MIDKTIINDFGRWIVSINKLGSSVLPWINNPRDNDYEIQVSSTNNRALISKLYSYKKCEDNMRESWFVSEKRYCNLFCYQYHYAQKEYGEDVDDYNIFEHKTDYKKCLVAFGLNESNRDIKIWYHVLTGIYMLENGDYILTEEQAENVRLCHDRQMTEEIYNFIQVKLLEYQSEEE